MIGKNLGPYEIVAKLGAGGMGEVYRARDGRLRRDVAIKLLRSDLTPTEEDRRRLEREARSVAQLSHPNVCTLFDVGREGDTAYLVMELLEGETLAERLRRGRPSQGELLLWSAEIAAALAAAHARDIVHCDLKPQNVMLTATGVKLLDFGLAQAAIAVDAEISRTLAVMPGGGSQGSVGGTLPYMAPEQIEGGTPDARSDLFAFGAVLFEMFTGRRAFVGASLPAVASAVLNQPPPDVADFAPGTPALLRSLVQRCLAKEPSARWQSARDAEFLLRGLEAAPDQAARSTGSNVRTAATRLPWAIAVLAIIASIAFVLKPRSSDGPGAGGRSARFLLSPPPDVGFQYYFEGDSFAVSPDGATIAFVCREHEGGSRYIATRPLDALELQRVPGTEGASSLFWSPDGHSIGFFAGSSLKVVRVDGGAPVPVCEVSEGGGKSASWGVNGSILYAAVQGNAIYRVPASGGTPEVVIAADRSGTEWRVSYPYWLPDGESFVYVTGHGVGGGTLKLVRPGAPPREVMPCGSKVQFTRPDLFVFAEGGALFGQRIDWREGVRIGGAFSIADSVWFFLSTGGAQFATSAGGTLVLQARSDESALQWFDRAGRPQEGLGPPGGYLDLHLAPDGRTLWFSRSRPGINTYDIWSLDLDRMVETRVTSGLSSEFQPLPPAAEGSLYFAAASRGAPQVFVRRLDDGEETLVAPSPGGFQIPTALSPDGRHLVYIERDERTDFRPLLLDLQDPSAVPQPLLPEQLSGLEAAFSPDGRTLALVSNESGDMELYLSPFPGPGPRRRISRAGARTLRWSADGRELFYLSPRDGLMVVSMTDGPQAAPGEPVVLIGPQITNGWLDFDVTRDGQRILALVSRVDASRLPVQVVVDWPAGL